MENNNFETTVNERELTPERYPEPPQPPKK